jgi:hypothetical protein
MGNPNMNMGMSIDESMNGMQGGPGMYWFLHINSKWIIIQEKTTLFLFLYKTTPWCDRIHWDNAHLSTLMSITSPHVSTACAVFVDWECITLASKSCTLLLNIVTQSICTLDSKVTKAEWGILSRGLQRTSSRNRYCWDIQN